MTHRPLTEKGRQALEKALHVPITRDDDGRLPFRKPVLDTLVANGMLDVDDGGGGALTFTITQAGRDALKREIPRFLHARPHRNYTTNPALAARGEPEAVDNTTLARYSQQADQRRVLTTAEQQRNLDEIALDLRLARALQAAADIGVDISRQRASIHRRIEALERRLNEKRDAA